MGPYRPVYQFIFVYKILSNVSYGSHFFVQLHKWFTRNFGHKGALVQNIGTQQNTLKSIEILWKIRNLYDLRDISKKRGRRRQPPPPFLSTSPLYIQIPYFPYNFYIFPCILLCARVPKTNQELKFHFNQRIEKTMVFQFFA